MKRAPTKSDLTSAFVHELFEYDPDIGVLYHKKRHGVIEGNIAGSVNNRGYINVKIYGVPYLAHRVIWLYVKGEWPDGSLEVDHRNRNRKDNRWGNLRLATRPKNTANANIRTTRKYGTLKGAFWHKNIQRWSSMFNENGKTYFLGYYATEQEAHDIYVKKSREILGEFAPF